MAASAGGSRAPRLLLCGGGHAMLPSLSRARSWIEAGASVTLVSDHRYLYYSGMVPEYLGGVYTPDQVRIDLEALCAREGLLFHGSRAVHLDVSTRTLHTAEGQSLPYDVVAFDIGARNPGEHGAALPTKPLHHLTTLADRLRETLASPPAPFSLVIVGGGAAGIEVALNVAARFRRHGRSASLGLTVLERSSSLLPGFPATLQRHVQQRLTALGVATRCDVDVTGVSPDGVSLEGHHRLPADVVLWATGASGPDLFREARLPCDARGFLRVDASLRCLADLRIFAAGDCAAVDGYEDLPRIGVHAVKQGPVLQRNLTQAMTALRRGERLGGPGNASFKPYPLAPLILSTGKPAGLWVAGSIWLRGRPLLRLKHFVDRRWIRRYAPAWQGAGLRALCRAEAACSGL